MKLHDIGANVRSLTCDGPSCHFTMIKELGGSIKHDDLRPYFRHPADPEVTVHVFLDACHMLKLFRNCLGECKTLLDQDKQSISWVPIEELQQLQKQEGLRLGNKLGRRHIDFKSNIMKVNIAAQTLSASVADAIEYCNITLDLPQFKNTQALCVCIRLFDRLFDVLNSRNPLAKNYKAPLNVARENMIVPFLKDAYSYISKMTDVSGKLMTTTGRKTSFLGFMCCIQSVINFYAEHVKPSESPLKYLLTYKFSQDHLELFFCAVRISCGSNNNPTVHQFLSAYKRLLMRHEIRSNAGNVSSQDATTILDAASFQNKILASVPDSYQDITVARKYNLLLDDPVDYDDNELLDSVPTDPSEYAKSCIGYIAGFVVRMVQKRWKCDKCLDALTVETGDRSLDQLQYLLIKQKNRGGLLKPSPSVYLICKKNRNVRETNADCHWRNNGTGKKYHQRYLSFSFG